MTDTAQARRDYLKSFGVKMSPLVPDVEQQSPAMRDVLRQYDLPSAFDLFEIICETAIRALPPPMQDAVKIEHTNLRDMIVANAAASAFAYAMTVLRLVAPPR
jgi:hypothetical protein